MNVYKAHVLNASTMIIFGIWEYYSSYSPVSFLSIFIGVILLSLSNGVQYQTKALLRVVFGVTIIGLIGLLYRVVPDAMQSRSILQKFRAVTMAITSSIAIFYFLKLFMNSKHSKRMIHK